MRRTVFGSATKFCPRARDGLMPCSSSSSTIWDRLSTPVGLPGEVDLDDAGVDAGDLGERRPIEVDDAPGAVGTTVGDDAGGAGPVGDVGDGDDGALGDRQVGALTGPVVVVGGGAVLATGGRGP